MKIQLQFHILELDNRTGGRVFTHRFTAAKDQYFEAGAMRIPNTQTHFLVKELIRYLNTKLPSEDHINIIPYVIQQNNNRVFVNGVHTFVNEKDKLTAEELHFDDVPHPYKNKTADELLLKVVKPFIDLLNHNFEEGWKAIMKWDRVSFRYYLENEFKDKDNDNKPYPPAVVDFIEILSSQANQYALSFPEMVMQSLDFGEKDWFTIAGGMDRLPEGAAKVVGLENITYGARVYKIEVLGSGKLAVWADGDRGVVRGEYDNVLLAIPPAAVRMIRDRPHWSPKKEQALRAMYFEPLYKIGLRFKTRFWERVQKPCFGGQSISDQATRWIVYPSYGLHDDGPGVLLLYSWQSDASVWTSIPPNERVKHALRDLAQVYPQTDEIDIYSEFIEADNVAWTNRTPTGDCMFLPGQYSDYFKIAREPEGNIYFAGEHLSRHHTWISGALDSALQAVGQMMHSTMHSNQFDVPFGVLGPKPHLEISTKRYDGEEHRKNFIQDRAPKLDYDKLKEHFGIRMD